MMRNGLAQFNDLGQANMFKRFERLDIILFLRSWVVLYPVESMTMICGFPCMKCIIVFIMFMASLM